MRIYTYIYMYYQHLTLVIFEFLYLNELDALAHIQFSLEHEVEMIEVQLQLFVGVVNTKLGVWYASVSGMGRLIFTIHSHT